MSPDDLKVAFLTLGGTRADQLDFSWARWSATSAAVVSLRVLQATAGQLLGLPAA